MSFGKWIAERKNCGVRDLSPVQLDIYARQYADEIAATSIVNAFERLAVVLNTEFLTMGDIRANNGELEIYWAMMEDPEDDEKPEYEGRGVLSLIDKIAELDI